MAFDTNTEKTEGISKSNDLNSVQELNSSQGFITADDILKNCSNPEDVILTCSVEVSPTVVVAPKEAWVVSEPAPSLIIKSKESESKNILDLLLANILQKNKQQQQKIKLKILYLTMLPCMYQAKLQI